LGGEGDEDLENIEGKGVKEAKEGEGGLECAGFGFRWIGEAWWFGRL
jgi:hypothetical protein